MRCRWSGCGTRTKATFCSEHAKTYVRQRRGECDHHMHFARDPLAYLIWSRLRQLAEINTGLVDVSLAGMADDLQVHKTRVVRSFKWLCTSSDSRPAYLARVSVGRKGAPSTYLIVKHERLYEHTRASTKVHRDVPNTDKDSVHGGVRISNNSVHGGVPISDIGTQGCTESGGNVNSDNGIAPGRRKRRSKDKEGAGDSVISGKYDRASGLYAGEKRAQRRGKSYTPDPQQKPVVSLSELITKAEEENDGNAT